MSSFGRSFTKGFAPFIPRIANTISAGIIKNAEDEQLAKQQEEERKRLEEEARDKELQRQKEKETIKSLLLGTRTENYVPQSDIPDGVPNTPMLKSYQKTYTPEDIVAGYVDLSKEGKQDFDKARKLQQDMKPEPSEPEIDYEPVINQYLNTEDTAAKLNLYSRLPSAVQKKLDKLEKKPERQVRSEAIDTVIDFYTRGNLEGFGDTYAELTDDERKVVDDIVENTKPKYYKTDNGYELVYPNGQVKFIKGLDTDENDTPRVSKDLINMDKDLYENNVKLYGLLKNFDEQLKIAQNTAEEEYEFKLKQIEEEKSSMTDEQLLNAELLSEDPKKKQVGVRVDGEIFYKKQNFKNYVKAKSLENSDKLATYLNTENARKLYETLKENTAETFYKTVEEAFDTAQISESDYEILQRIYRQLTFSPYPL